MEFPLLGSFGIYVKYKENSIIDIGCKLGQTLPSTPLNNPPPLFSKISNVKDFLVYFVLAFKYNFKQVLL